MNYTEFGGGAAVISAQETARQNTHPWIQERLARLGGEARV